MFRMTRRLAGQMDPSNLAAFYLLSFKLICFFANLNCVKRLSWGMRHTEYHGEIIVSLACFPPLGRLCSGLSTVGR